MRCEGVLRTLYEDLLHRRLGADAALSILYGYKFNVLYSYNADTAHDFAFSAALQ